jgi:hypothetical protein
MADDIIEISPAPVENATVTPNTELATQMAIALNGGIPPANTAVVTPTEQVQPDLPIPTPDIFTPFKEKFGYATPDEAIAEIEQYRAYKATPPPTPEYEFENEDSAKLFKAWQAGKKAEVFNYLRQEQEIETLINKDVNKDTAADIVKLGMQLKYKDLTPDEINYKFNRQFAIPPKPVHLDTEEVEDYQQRLSAWEAISADKTMELVIEAKLAKPELQNSKSKLVFPEIESQVDEGYAQYLKNVEMGNKIREEAIENFKAFTPKELETKIGFNDEANKIAFEFKYESNAENFERIREMAIDMQKFYATCYNPDGTPDRRKFMKALDYAVNGDKIVMEAMKQAKNATIKASLPDNSVGGLVRQMPQGQNELSELDQKMRFALKGHAGF